MNRSCERVGQFCIIADDVVIGEGTRVWHYVQIREGARIGRNCVIGSRVEIGQGVVIGDGTHVGAGAQLHHPAVIGSGVFIGPQAFFSNDKYPSLAAEFEPQGVTVGDGAAIGAGAMIVGGVTVGTGAFVGMGAIVTHDVADGEMVKGTPARVYGRREMHWPGTAVQHYGPLCDKQRCRMCEAASMDQYREWMERMMREDG
jgi:acetyltransferase-like isoleucine patch superfamily enzyme